MSASTVVAPRGYARPMPQVWTRNRAGTGPSAGRFLVRSPLLERPQIHMIVLPLDWELESTQIYLVEGEPSKSSQNSTLQRDHCRSEGALGTVAAP